MIQDKDNLIKNLIHESKNKDQKIIYLNKDIIRIKKEKDEQEISFQNIIKDLQFIQNGTNNNTVLPEKSEKVIKYNKIEAK